MARSYDRFYIGGEWVPPAGADLLEVISPVTQEVIATVPEAVNADIDGAVTAATEAFDGADGPSSRRSSGLATSIKFAQGTCPVVRKWRV